MLSPIRYELFVKFATAVATALTAEAALLTTAVLFGDVTTTQSFLKDDAVVIDVGINSVEDSTDKRGYKLIGDVDYDNVKSKASYITQVPGGVGPMTIAMLLRNTFQACRRSVMG